MGVEDRTVRAYEEVVVDMSKGAPIKFLKLMDFYDNKIPVSSMRNKVMDSFGISPEELERRILLDPDVNILYRGMIKFMTEDLANRNFPSKTQLQKEAKILARNMMFRNESYSKLVQTEFKDSIRLSMHPSINNGTKYSFQLIPSPKAFTSPWHCALLLDNENQYATIHRKDAEAAGYELIYKDGQPYYFQQN
jgi:pyoverdine/dityrosine biosynthesis protein Dit1